MINNPNENISPGQTVWCKLTRKPLIIQEVHYKMDVNPQYEVQNRIIEAVTVRYLSQKHDEFKIAKVFLFEISFTELKNQNDEKSKHQNKYSANSKGICVSKVGG